MKVDKVLVPPTVPIPLRYPLHTALNLWFLLRFGLRYDICIAMESLAFVTAYPLRRIGLIRRLVYYAVDFSPRRFTHGAIDGLYHFVDRLACTKADAFWAMTRQMLAGREMFGVTPANCAPFVLVPIGYDTARIRILSPDAVNRHDIIFMGALRDSSGVELTVRAIPHIVQRLPDVRLTIIGHGRLEDQLVGLASHLGIAEHVHFGGYVADFWELTRMLASKGIGLAPYKPDPQSFSNYSDPSRIKLYLACGLPVITTGITTMAKEIQDTQSGIVIDYEERELASAVSAIFEDAKTYERYKSAATALGARFDINNILANAFDAIPD